MKLDAECAKAITRMQSWISSFNSPKNSVGIGKGCTLNTGSAWLLIRCATTKIRTVTHET